VLTVLSVVLLQTKMVTQVALPLFYWRYTMIDFVDAIKSLDSSYNVYIDGDINSQEDWDNKVKFINREKMQMNNCHFC
jgi:hypothetical protein